MTRFWVLACVWALVSVSASAAEPFPLRDGDIVALIGSTFIERDQRDGFLELALTLSAPHANVSFRNLGWSGDTANGRARRYFGSTEEGYKHLLDHLDVVKPSVIIVCYGTNEAFEGEEGRGEFLAAYGKLLGDLRQRTERILLVSPPPLDSANSPAPAVAERFNKELAAQANAIKELAANDSLGFVDLFTPLHEELSSASAAEPLTENGIHLTPDGYRLAAKRLMMSIAAQHHENDVQVVDVTQPLTPAQERLRAAILEKNVLFFHRHRPENETYLRGFRKHEQGNNAAEIYAFEPLVAEKDREIFKLREAAQNRSEK